MAEVTLDYLILEILMTVAPRCGRLWLYNACAVFLYFHVRIIKRIDIYGESAGMIGQVLATWHAAVTETAGVVVAHLSFIVSIILVGQTYPLDRVVLTVQFHEDTDELLSDEPVTDHFSVVSLTVVIPMHQPQVTEVTVADDIVWAPRLSLHLLPDAVRNLLDRETRRKILALCRMNATEPE